MFDRKAFRSDAHNAIIDPKAFKRALRIAREYPNMCVAYCREETEGLVILHKYRSGNPNTIAAIEAALARPVVRHATPHASVYAEPTA